MTGEADNGIILNMKLKGDRQKILRIGAYGASNKSTRYQRSGMLRFAAAHDDVQLVFMDAANLPEDAANGGEGFRRECLDGVIVNCWIEQNIINGAIPSAFTCHDRSVYPQIKADVVTEIDNAAIARTAADLLLNRGHTHFSYIPAFLQTERNHCAARKTAFTARISERGYSVAAYESDNWDEGTEYDKLTRLADFLAGLPKPCAVFAYSDSVAHKTLDACHLAHLRVPDQVNIIGVDNDTELCENVLPTLSSVQPEFERSGYLAAEALYALLKGRKPRKRLVFGVQTVVERNSTRDLRGGGLLVLRATDIIRSRFTDSAFRAEHLAAKLKVSRQLLDLRFREILGHSVHAEIERLRLDEAKRRLAATTETIDEIAHASGYNHNSSFRMAFTTATGLSPGNWRKQSGVSKTSLVKYVMKASPRNGQAIQVRR